MGKNNPQDKLDHGSLSFGEGRGEALYIIKIGGNVIDNPIQLAQFLKDFAGLSGAKILIHGGGKIATQTAAKLGVQTQMVNGRRITDAAMLDVVTMVYGGLVNKNIVAQLQANQVNAIGMTGADANAIKAVKRPVKDVDFGFVGDLLPDAVNANIIKTLLEAGLVPVFNALTHDGNGQLFNTNADTIASALALGLSSLYETKLIYCFEKNGVMRDINDDNSVIQEINPSYFEELKADGIIADGMLPKLQNAFDAIQNGVKEVYIGHAAKLAALQKESIFGTRLTK
ncbi:acetylglutamate kinase [Pedobacter aquae]|uniref:Acetylglutamate kinase n=1 Tax=Pedobacter aquae TaxID=2605747 RepID=A0A5C0VHT9_9SPHI|nr:acetylglutamate kinase [Pedobacter aquae]QEK52258.1 acetylglutamate kinase [Pedobacter aquae]